MGVRAGGAGLERFFIKANCSLLMSKENQKTTSDFDALDPRERGCSPLSDPEGEVETEKKLAASLNAFFSFLRLAASQLVLPLC